MNLPFLFHQCAYVIDYDCVGNSVNYKFVDADYDEHGVAKTLYIYFQGSNSITDWVENFLFTKKVYKEFRVHRGFYYAYSQIRDILLNEVYYNDYTKIIVVGYSHGGALCQLALEDLVYHFPKLDISGVAFETPRCLKVKKKYRDRWKTLITVRDGTDIVTHCPPKIFGYTDLGTMVKVKGDTSKVKKHIPKCVKYHYPQVVEDGLINHAAKEASSNKEV